MGPAVNLTIAVLVLVVGFLLIRSPRGWMRRFLRRGQLERVLIEDALKHLYSCHETHVAGSVDGIAGALELGRNRAAELAHQLEQRRLVRAAATGLELTKKGQQYALQVIRTHRLWEHYLAEQGVGESEWHSQADLVEHQLTPDEVNALAARMGDPVFDPHGDPIPSAGGSVRRPEGTLLTAVQPGRLVRIVHIEDEPESTYRILRDAQLQSGTIITVIDTTPEGITVDTGAARSVLAPVVAVNVTVQPLDEQVADRVSLRRLSSLACGDEAQVTDISPGCRGVERRRLLDLGLVPGTKVKAEFASPAGDPVAYRVRGALIALRTQQAEMIHITDPQPQGA